MARISSKGKKVCTEIERLSFASTLKIAMPLLRIAGTQSHPVSEWENIWHSAPPPFSGASSH